MRLAFLVFPLLFSAACFAQDRPQNAGPAVVEYFTSGDCPSCAGGNNLFASLVDNMAVVPIACHITPVEQPAAASATGWSSCTDRQNSYARLFNKGPFLPQAVVNGTLSADANNRGDVMEAIRSAPPARPLAIQYQAGLMAATLDADSEAGNSRIFVFVMDQGAPPYANPVLRILDQGAWDGAPRQLTIPVAIEAERVALVVQDVPTGRILSAGYAVDRLP